MLSNNRRVDDQTSQHFVHWRLAIEQRIVIGCMNPPIALRLIRKENL